MKKTLLLSLMSLCAFTGFAQDDDVYFVPSKDVQQTTISDGSTYTVLESEAGNDEWYAGRSTGRDVDAYNRRGNYNEYGVAVDTVDDDAYADDYEDGSCTSRIVRFHSPGYVIVASPYYWDYNYWYDPWYSWGWHYGWYDPWYSWSWGWGWHSPCHASLILLS